MSFPVPVNGETAFAEQLTAISKCLNGDSGAGQAIQHVAFNSDTLYSLLLKNLASLSLALQVRSFDDVVLLQVRGDGVTLSPDGSAAAAALTTSHAQDVSNKTLIAPILTGLVDLTAGQLKYEDSVAALASVAGVLTPTAYGKRFSVSDASNTVITSIAVTAGREIDLLFTNAGVQVTSATIMKLDGNFVSLAGARLSLWCDGTNWYERGRSGHGVLGCRVHRTSDQTGLSGDTKVIWQTDGAGHGYDYGNLWVASPNPTRLTVPVGGAGKYLLGGTVTFADDDVYGRGWLKVNNTIAQRLFAGQPKATGHQPAYTFSTTLNLADGDYVELEVNSDTDQDVIGAGSDDTHIFMTRLGT